MQLIDRDRSRIKKEFGKKNESRALKLWPASASTPVQSDANGWIQCFQMVIIVVYGIEGNAFDKRGGVDRFSSRERANSVLQLSLEDVPAIVSSFIRPGTRPT